MTVKDLIEKLKEYEPDVEVKIEYDGPDARQFLRIHFLTYYESENALVLSEG